MQTAKLGGKTQVYVREVDQDGDIGPFRAQAGLQLAVFAVDVGHVQDHFRDAHHGDIFGAHHPAQSQVCHARASQPKKLSLRRQAAYLRHQQRAVVFAAGLAGREKDLRASSLSLTLPVNLQVRSTPLRSGRDDNSSWETNLSSRPEL